MNGKKQVEGPIHLSDSAEKRDLDGQRDRTIPASGTWESKVTREDREVRSGRAQGQAHTRRCLDNFAGRRPSVDP